MRVARKRKPSLAEAAKDAALMAICDPFGWFCVFLVFGKFWKIGLILLALIFVVGMITGFVILWINHWDT